MLHAALPLLLAIVAQEAPQDADGLSALLRRKIQEGPWGLELLDDCERLLEAADLRREELVAAWDRAKKDAPEAPRFLLFRVRLARPITSRFDSEAALEGLARRFPDDPPTLFFAAKARLESGRHNEARRALETLLEKDPAADRRPAVRLWLAECCAKSGAPALAAEHLRRAEPVEEPLFLGALASRLGLRDDAARLYARVLREETEAGRAPKPKVVPAPGQSVEAALAALDPEEALAELDPDGRRSGQAPVLHRFAAMQSYDRGGTRWAVVRAGIALLEDDGGRRDYRSKAKILIRDACRGFREEDWIELRRLPLPRMPAETAAAAKRRLEDLASDDPAVRVSARGELRKIGVRALPLLLEKCDAADIDLKSNVRETIRAILTGPEGP
jgi:tetratricopeptide (TPR) repeat protein